MQAKLILFCASLALFLLSVNPANAQQSCEELLKESETLWIKLDFEGSDLRLERAEQVCGESPEIYWRRARNIYSKLERIPRDKKPSEAELQKKYSEMLELADKCIAVDEKDGECWLWRAVSLGRLGSTQNIVKTSLKVQDLEQAMLKGIELEPTYRSYNGAASSLADLHSMLGIFYRVLPEWTCGFPFQQIIGTCGDLDKSIELHRKAVEREPARIEYWKELAISLSCRGQKRGSREDIDQAVKIFRELQSMPEFKATDGIDKEHSLMLIEHPDMACGYSRDAQQEQSKESIEKAIK